MPKAFSAISSAIIQINVFSPILRSSDFLLVDAGEEAETGSA
ncbi:hypothetical protein [Alteripontixanthobacter muriae]